ncbi:S-isoprenylcysteine methyltransferase [Synechococcus sp. RSCCF101]|uniref:methyltransferase family protein n=1 Tax=Synechococcus sp. RSCCF101 TaxID=2511069 RepID=UPI0012494AC0|nr:methyltransferase [Synechococcus sp. RSCCF101]QEY32452.1 S-isoprenylcysteine methyltransferase [Synechococcus sp. RSCCF101]
MAAAPPSPKPSSPPEPALVNAAGQSLPAALSGWGFSWQGWRSNARGEWWLLAQAVLILLNALPATPAPSSLGLSWPLALQLIGWGCFGLGLLLALQGFLGLGASLSPLPEPKPGAALITAGPYRRCRHPLYQAVLVCGLGVTLALGSLLHLGLLIALALVLRGKARREESRLLALHPEYGAYRARTPAIVPRFAGLDWRC